LLTLILDQVDAGHQLQRLRQFQSLLKMINKKAGLACFLFILSAFFAGCVPHINVPPGLANKGILPLSSTDAFLGSNLFIAREVERSAYLYHFLQSHGAPAAIEIIQERGYDTKLLLFYPKQKSVFVALPDQKELNRQWIVRGPYQVTRLDYRQLQRIQKALKGEPLFHIYGRDYRFQTYNKQEPREIVKLVLPPAPKTTSKKKVKSSKKTGSSKQKAPTITAKKEPEPKEFKPLNVDQQALLMSRGFAERAENGDIIHTVKHENESLELISRWYTSSKKNTQKLQDLNGLPNTPLAVGTRITIPADLVRKTKAMPIDYE
jgi:hypothetical protein